MTILLIRHGETELNVSRVLQPAATPLGARGIAQAEALGARLAGMRVTAILASDLPRALRTAQAVAAATGAPIETTPLLHERNFGDLRGLPYDGLAVNPLADRAAPPGGESADGFEDRVARAFALVLTHHAALTLTAPGATLAVVTHGLVIRALLRLRLGLDAGAVNALHIGNTSLTVFDPRPPHAVSLLDCTRHLDAERADDAGALSGG
jgi:2,3-bisphosphoglycerate-dependent phosphoglycerate mutase